MRSTSRSTFPSGSVGYHPEHRIRHRAAAGFRRCGTAAALQWLRVALGSNPTGIACEIDKRPSCGRITPRCVAADRLVGYPSGQRGQTVNLLAYAFDGSNPSPTTTLKPLYKSTLQPVLTVISSMWPFSSEGASLLLSSLAFLSIKPQKVIQRPKAGIGPKHAVNARPA